MTPSARKTEVGLVRSSGGDLLPRAGNGWNGSLPRDTVMSTSATEKIGNGNGSILVTSVVISTKEFPSVNE